MLCCEECNIGFSKPSNLKAHIKRKHPDKLDILAPRMRAQMGSGSYVCSECSKCFSNVGNLNRHLKTHSDKLDGLASSQEKNFSCNLCSVQFQSAKNFKKHNLCHICISSKTVKCSLCDYKGASTDIVILHYQNEHNLVIENKKLEFETLDAFQSWKLRIESETYASFVIRRGSKIKAGYIKTEYYCHRSGHFKTRGKNIRKIKTQGTNKIGGYSSAKMTVLDKAGKYVVQFCGSHVGHRQEQDLGHLFLTKEERQNIAAKIASKVPLQVILDEIRDSVSNCHLERVHLLKKKDLYNIENSFNLRDSSVRHQNDAVSVDAWVNELKENNSVLFYKPQDSINDKYPELKQNDFVLIIMTKGQKDLLLNFGHDCVCIDGTHGLNGYGFELHTLLVLDDLREGYPCAFLISNRSDVDVLKLFFSCIEQNIENKISPHIFMSDMAEAYFNAWIEVMHPPELRLFCTWHVDKAWRKQLDKILNKDKKVLIYRMLRILLHEIDIQSFTALLNKFLQYCKESLDTLEFGIYFEQYYACRSEQWAYCFRVNSGLNTNMHIERMHRTIKHLYLNGKLVKRLDRAIGAIMRFVRDKLFDRLIVLHKGKLCTKLSTLRNRHKKSESLDITKVIQNDLTWIVPSDSRNEMYVVEEIKSKCTCKLICDY